MFSGLPSYRRSSDSDLSNVICGGNGAAMGDPKAHRRYARSDVV